MIVFFLLLSEILVLIDCRSVSDSGSLLEPLQCDRVPVTGFQVGVASSFKVHSQICVFVHHQSTLSLPYNLKSRILWSLIVGFFVCIAFPHTSTQYVTTSHSVNIKTDRENLLCLGTSEPVCLLRSHLQPWLMFVKSHSSTLTQELKCTLAKSLSFLQRLSRLWTKL